MVTVSTSDERMVEASVEVLISKYRPDGVAPAEFLGAQFDAGLAFVHFPEGCGGLGLSRKLQPLITSRLEGAGAPVGWRRNPIGYGMAAPTILAMGSEEQKRRYLRPLFTCEEIWCQLFSEPGAGSDVAGLSTRAVPDGEGWVLNGQKVWTSEAHVARYGMVLARTEPQAEKHKGLTYFVVDMLAEGIKVLPLRQMTGDAEFNEVYFTNVRIPDSERLSEVGDGWRGAIVTLMNERVFIGGSVPVRGSGPISAALSMWDGVPIEGRSYSCRDRLASLWIEAEVLRLTNLRAAALSQAGTPGPEGSIGKLMSAELDKRVYNFCVDLLGAEGMLYDSYEMRRPELADEEGVVTRTFLRSRANSIEGGTSEVMRNILGERVLGLPGDVRVDKNLPWSQLPRT